MLELPVGHAMFLHVSNGLWSIDASGFDVEVTSDPARPVTKPARKSPTHLLADARCGWSSATNSSRPKSPPAW